MICAGCGTQISQLRLEAVPNATHCPPCLEAAGDVPLLRRWDDYKGLGVEDVEVDEVFFVTPGLGELNIDLPVVVTPHTSYLDQVLWRSGAAVCRALELRMRAEHAQ